MKLVIERKKVLPVLSSVIGAIARKNSMPILDYLHVMGDGESLRLTGSDLEMTIRATVRDVVHTPFTALWPARRMMEIVKSYPDDGVIGIAQDEPEKMVIKCGRSRFSMLTMDPQDYPLIDEGQAFDQEFMISENSLRSCLSKTDFAIATQDVRYYLNGLLFHGQDQRINFVATDGHRLAKTHQELELVFSEEWQAIIPSSAVAEIKKACREGVCTVSISKNLVKFAFSSEQVLIVKQIDGRFPDYLLVIPRSFTKKVALNRSGFNNAVQRIRLVLDKTSGVELHLSEGLLELKGGAESERAEDQMDVTYTGDELLIGVNSTYLIDVLRVIESENIKLHCNGSGDVIQLINPDQSGDVYVIMPMRI